MSTTRRQMLGLLGSAIAAPVILKARIAEATTPSVSLVGALRFLEADATHGRVAPMVAARPDGGYLATWVDHDPFTAFTARLRTYNEAGAALSATQTLGNLADESTAPVVNADGTAFVFYTTGFSPSVKLYGRKVTALGVLTGAPVGIANSPGYVDDPVVAAARLKNNNIAATWLGETPSHPTLVHERIVSKVGVGVTADALVAANTFYQRVSCVTPLVGGGYVVGYSFDVPGTYPNTYFRAQMYSALGVKVNAPIGIARQDENAYTFDIAPLANGDFVVVYMDGGSETAYLALRFYSAAGKPVGGIHYGSFFGFNFYMPVHPKIAVLPNGKILVVCEATIGTAATSAGWQSSVGAIVFSAAGAQLGPAVRLDAIVIPPDTDSYPVVSSLAQLKDGTFIAGWSRYNPTGHHMQAYLAHLKVA